MGEWTTCPFCQLKHSRRADGVCPRCKQSFAAGSAGPPAVEPMAAPGPARRVVATPITTAMPDVYDGSAPPRSDTASAESTYATPGGTVLAQGVPLGGRIAGGVLLINALLLLAETAVTAKTPGSIGMRSSLVDLIVGGGLVAGSERMLVWAKVRVVLGAIVFTIIQFAGGSALGGLFQLLFCGCLMALLFGNAGKIRIGIAGGLVGIYFLLEVIGLLALSHS